MAIKSIPSISGPSYGGVIYGLSLNAGYSSEASSLTLSVVSSNGSYSPPVLNSRVSVSFGNFRFNGVVWSYNLKQSAGEKTLEVIIKDNSVILDRTAVVLWKKGLMNITGSTVNVTKKISLDEQVLKPSVRGSGSSVTFAVNEVSLAPQDVIRPVASYSGWFGDAFLIGQETWPDSTCDIPSTYYTFNMLKAGFKFNSASAPSNNELKATHEGTFREVLSNWCGDLGYDFYWDYSSDTLVFFNTSHGIANIPDIVNSSIINKSISSTMDGTYAQYGVSYTARPKEPLKELSVSKNFKTSISINPISVNYFIRRSAGVNLDGGGSDGYSNRSSSEVIRAAMLGYVSRALRDLWLYTKQVSKTGLPLLGFGNDYKNLNSSKVLATLKKAGYLDPISQLEEFDGPGLPNYTCFIMDYNKEVADGIFEAEKNVLSNVGKWYRIPISSNTFFYCNSKTVTEISVSVDPEGTVQEGENQDFNGQKVYDRGGQMSHDAGELQEQLGLMEGTNVSNIQNCLPIIIDLKESGLLQNFIDQQLVDKKEKRNSLVFFPQDKLINSKINLNAQFSKSAHPLEKTFREIYDAQNSSSGKKCLDYEAKLEASQCISAKEEARQKAVKQAGITDENNEDSGYPSGLVSKSAHKCKVSLNGGSADFFSASDGQYRVNIEYSLNTRQISTTQNNLQKLFSSGTIGRAGDVAEIRIAVNDITDSGEDFFAKKRSGEIEVVPTIINSNPTKSISYVFAGEPVGLSMSPRSGLSKLDISLSSDGFVTTVDYSTRSPKPPKNSNPIRIANSQLNRASFNGM